MKTKSICGSRSRRMLLVAGLAVCAFANAADFDATVWRGETAYVDIPDVRWNDMCKAEQDAYIRRAENVMRGY